ncbi:hypothetical protein QCA50_018699 [Cerrena zonata]|uniref:Uncharacterized protein n=1 Tax=Cerrena zonata TaxID=2478898 RepID=A0AAW0FGV7_9APHY
MTMVVEVPKFKTTVPRSPKASSNSPEWDELRTKEWVLEQQSLSRSRLHETIPTSDAIPDYLDIPLPSGSYQQKDLEKRLEQQYQELHELELQQMHIEVLQRAKVESIAKIEHLLQQGQTSGFREVEEVLQERGPGSSVGNQLEYRLRSSKQL